MKHDCATEDRKLPIDRPCSACSEDPNMERHDHCPPFREPVASPQATFQETTIGSNSVNYSGDGCGDIENLEKCPTCNGYHAGGCHRAAQPAAGTTPRKFRTKPLEKWAIQVSAENLAAVCDFMGGEEHRNIDFSINYVKVTVHINTLEGTMKAQQGDWIVKGVKGEFYPVKPDIFEVNYEPAE